MKITVVDMITFAVGFAMTMTLLFIAAHAHS